MPGDLTNPGRVTLGHPGVDRICGGVEQQREIVAVPAPRARVSAGGQDIPARPTAARAAETCSAPVCSSDPTATSARAAASRAGPNGRSRPGSIAATQPTATPTAAAVVTDRTSPDAVE